MGDKLALPKIIDDMGGLYSHASEAFAAGERHGRDEFYRSAQIRLSQISVEQESGPVDGPEAVIATRGFHVAESCCKALRMIKEAFDNRRRTV